MLKVKRFFAKLSQDAQVSFCAANFLQNVSDNSGYSEGLRKNIASIEAKFRELQALGLNIFREQGLEFENNEDVENILALLNHIYDILSNDNYIRSSSKHYYGIKNIVFTAPNSTYKTKANSGVLLINNDVYQSKYRKGSYLTAQFRAASVNDLRPMLKNVRKSKDFVTFNPYKLEHFKNFKTTFEVKLPDTYENISHEGNAAIKFKLNFKNKKNREILPLEVIFVKDDKKSPEKFGKTLIRIKGEKYKKYNQSTPYQDFNPDDLGPGWYNFFKGINDTGVDAAGVMTPKILLGLISRLMAIYEEKQKKGVVLSRHASLFNVSLKDTAQNFPLSFKAKSFYQKDVQTGIKTQLERIQNTYNIHIYFDNSLDTIKDLRQGCDKVLAFLSSITPGSKILKSLQQNETKTIVIEKFSRSKRKIIHGRLILIKICE
ncbi:MAG: hypothetical protein OMM_13219, partial [Candidatus Magnetoglobus multicellularis str. Araruama]